MYLIYDQKHNNQFQRLNIAWSPAIYGEYFVVEGNVYIFYVIFRSAEPNCTSANKGMDSIIIFLSLSLSLRSFTTNYDLLDFAPSACTSHKPKRPTNNSNQNYNENVQMH